MKTKTYLMMFEQLIELLGCDYSTGSQLADSTLSKIGADFIDRSALWESEVLLERLASTWWEVEVNLHDQPSRCLYVADSLVDAIRLRPHIDVSFWSTWHSSVACFVADMEEWTEQQYYVW